MELLVVISIIGLLTSIVGASLVLAREKGRDAGRIGQIEEVTKALALYYSNHGQYPTPANPTGNNDSIPNTWATMMAALNSDGVIPVSFTMADQKSPLSFSLTNTAEAMAIPQPVYWKCSIQDPLYKTATDYPVSFAYVSMNGGQDYKIRFHMEVGNTTIVNKSPTTFIDSSTTGVTACDSSLGYYCINSN